MKFKEEIKKLGAEIFQYDLCIGSRGGYFTGVKRIICFTKEEISVQIGRYKVSVFGEGIEIVKLIGGDLAFKGVIKKSEWGYL